MEYTDFISGITKGIECIARKYSLFSIIDGEYRMRPAISWALKEEYFFIRIRTSATNTDIAIGFHDPDSVFVTFRTEDHQSLRDLAMHIRHAAKSHAICSTDHLLCEASLSEASLSNALQHLDSSMGKVIIAVDNMYMFDDCSFGWAETVYALMKWIDGNDRMIKRLTRSSDNFPLVLKVARLMGREAEIKRVIHNAEAARTIV